MARQKKRRYAALQTMDNVVDGRGYEPDWFERTFGSERTVLLELGCGQGEYTLALARGRPECGVLGIDRNGSRLWKGAEKALAEGLTNAYFLRSSVEQVEDHIPPGRVSEIWLPFPDPLRKSRQAKHRLPSPLFLKRYQRLLSPGGAVHLKTDDSDLVDFAERAVRPVGGSLVEGSTPFVGGDDAAAAVQTTYEKRYRAEGRTIYERTFRLD